jgi:integrase
MKAQGRAKRLTDSFIEALPPPPSKDGKPTTKDYFDYGRGSVSGLAVRVTSSGFKSFVLVGRFNGRNPTRVSIGSFPANNMGEMRAKAESWNRLLDRGVDPRDEVRRQREEAARKRANTFRAAAEDYIRDHVAEKRTAKVIEALIRRELISRWGERPITEISPGDVKELIRQIKRKSKSAAHQAALYCRALFNWAFEQECYGLDVSPCARVKAKKLIGNREPRQHILAAPELRLLWKATEGKPEEVYPGAPFIRLLLLLGCRRAELAGMTRKELDLDKGLWALAGIRTKNGKPWVVPLPQLAIDILKAMPQFTGPYLFTTTSGKRPISGFSKIKEVLDRKITELNGGEPIAAWRLHDLRRSMRTGLSSLPVPGGDLVRELCIGHTMPGLHRVYDQHAYTSERQQAYELWCSRLLGIVEPTTDSNVIEFAARA